jgi:hypothetical protein
MKDGWDAADARTLSAQTRLPRALMTRIIKLVETVISICRADGKIFV